MSFVYRYDPMCGSYCNGPRMECCKDGEWVAFEAYAAVEKQRDAAIKEVERLREAAIQIRLGLIGMLLSDGLDAIDQKRRELFKITNGMVA